MVKPLEDELVITKTVNSAFIGTSLEAILREQSVSRLIIAGLTTPHCVSTTIRMATNLGFSVTLAEDATASFPLHDHNSRMFSAQEIQDSTLASLNEEFATILSTQQILDSL
ncbi:TPA: isochorismatase family protein [Streptococcus suis]